MLRSAAPVRTPPSGRGGAAVAPASYPRRMPADPSDLIDWDLAVRTADRLVKPGPQVGGEQAAAVVADLRSLAAQAEHHVLAFTGLDTPADVPPAAVVDRPAWVRSNVAAFRQVMTPVVGAITARGGLPTGVTRAVGRSVTGVQVGTLLSYLAGRVLGQYEIFVPPGPGGARAPGRLLLVAPNIVASEQALGVDPQDFRLWVCLHEETHRVQFTAHPWLRDHVEGELAAFVTASDLDPSALWQRLRDALGGIGDAIRGEGSLLELVQTPAQREVLERVQAFMSLVEGHAEFVMDGVGPQVVRTLPTIRARFDARRSGAGPLDRVVRRLLGIDLKMRQYAEGATFVRGVVERVGMAGFNRVWTGPHTLPSRAEIADPAAWVARVAAGGPALLAKGGPAPELPATGRPDPS